jgi:uncharacterized phiE125 gp8 family phage protein
MKAVLINVPSTEPVSTGDAQSHLRVTDEDLYIDELVKAAREQVERYLNRALIQQTWDVYFDHWENELRLPYSPVSAITHIKYYDLNGVLQTLDSSLYYFVKESDPACIVRKYNVTYPDLEYGRPSAIVVRQVCGYGDSPSDIPSPIVHAIKLVMTDMYEHRGTYVVGTSVSKMPKYITDLIHGYKLYG